MKINSIELQNFRQFVNERIEFNSDSDKKVSVIYGRNYIGKTTLIKALLWCLYRDDDSFKADPIHVNKELQDSCFSVGKQVTSSVTVDLEHNGFGYTIRTYQTFQSTRIDNKIKFVPTLKEPTRQIYKIDKAGNPIPIPNNLVDKEIESILPSNLRNYFFYDGENNKIDSVANKVSLRDAVRNIMNLNVREELIKLFSPTSSTGVKSRFSSQIQSADRERNDEIQEEIDRLNAEIESAEKNNEQAKLDIEKLRGDAADLEARIEANSQAEELQRKLNEGRIALRELREARDKLFERLCKSLDSAGGENPGLAGIYIAMVLKSNDLANQFSNLQLTNRAYKHQSELSVDEIIAKGVCICGQPIHEGDEHYKHLIEAKEFLFPRDYSAMLHGFLKTYNVKYESADEAAKAIHKIASTLKKTIQSIDQQIEDNNEYEKKLGNFSGDVGKWRRDATEWLRQANEKEVAVNYSEQTIIPQKKARIQKLLAEQEKLADASDKNKKIHKYCAYVDAVYALASDRLEKKKNGIIEALQNQANEVFHGILNKKEKDLYLDPATFNVELKQNGQKIIGATSESIAKNLGFVAGLIYLAKNKNLIGSGDGDDDLPDDYPLFIDAPFSELDEQNVRNAAKILPEYCSQLVITLLDKDYNIAKEPLSVYLDKTYHLSTNENTTTSSFKEEN